MGQISDIRETFFQECEELMEALQDGLSSIQEDLPDGDVNTETVNAVFRAVHSIKGGAGAFSLEPLVKFSHRFETALDSLRSGKITADDSLLNIFLRSADHLSDLISTSRSGEDLGALGGSELMEKLAAAVGETESDQNSKAEDFGFAPTAINLDLPEAEGASDGLECKYTIFFKPRRDLYANGHDPSILFRVLFEVAQGVAAVDSSNLPDFDSLDWQESYLSWSITFTSDLPEHVILETFEFVDGLCDLTFHPLETDSVEVGLEEIDDSQINPTSYSNSASRKPSLEEEDEKGRKGATGPKATVRVELERVDRLINIVGELVINQAMLSQCVAQAGIPPRSDIGSGLDEFRNLAREIQESVMAIRAQTIKPLFQRMSRIVRDASDISGKQILLATEGETTEVDKTVIERLADPLTHMIRNAVDHGIERSADRVAAGKPEQGTVTLSAAHRSGRVMIEVSDDGSGIDRSKVRSIAVKKGLISPDAELTDAEIDKLLFLPGFSTAATVSDLSGRGVGMDVVKSAIQALGGRVNIFSVPGKGTTFQISLPLTLAVLDGMVVDVAGQTMVIPITAIVETLRPPPQDIHALAGSGQVVAIRGSFVPIVDLGAVFGHRDPVSDYAERVLLLVETDQHGLCALAVDAIFDQRQVVIKGLENNYGHVPGVAAATILGDGKIALIIDPEETVVRASSDPRSQPMRQTEVF